ncbi:hypothetical protein S83_047724, partial [Arachis hypogaea]
PVTENNANLKTCFFHVLFKGGYGECVSCSHSKLIVQRDIAKACFWTNPLQHQSKRNCAFFLAYYSLLF